MNENIEIMGFDQETKTLRILGHEINEKYESLEAFFEEVKRLKEIEIKYNNLSKKHIEYITKKDFAKLCKISRPYLDKLLNSGMTREEIYNFCELRAKLK